MKANETNLNFLIGDETQFVIPYFQRAYVWDEENWQRLLDSLSSSNSSHYLGTIIIQENLKNDNGFYSYSIIDGQQRITTLSILMRAIIDKLGTTPVKSALEGKLFCRYNPMYDYSEIVDGHKNSVVKLVPGFQDKDTYNCLIENPETAIHFYPNSQIVKCYQYFIDELNDPHLATTIYSMLIKHETNFIVKIELEHNDNAQAIFDVANGTGVSLTCADIIKNSLFLSISDEVNRLKIYNDTWHIVFDGSDYKFWTSLYNKRSNIENLLFAVAHIEKHNDIYVFNPLEDTFETLSKNYTAFFSTLSQDELFDFINRFIKYAKIYKEYLTINDDYKHKFSDLIPRYILSFKCLSVSTVFLPYLLKLFEPNCDDDGFIIPNKESIITNELKALETILIRANILKNLDFSDFIEGETSKPSSKNFNKAIIQVIRDMNPSNIFTQTQLNSIYKNELIQKGLKKIDNNTAKLILFLINLKLVDELGKNTNTHEYSFKYELEHIMPQNYELHWGLPNKKINGEEIIMDLDKKEYRSSFIFQIGNMTIITPNANRTIKNYHIKTKVDGDTSKKTKAGIRKGFHGYAMCATEPISADFIKDIILANYSWDEKMIQERTERLTHTILELWKS